MHHEHRVRTNQQDTNFTLNDAGHESHVHQHAVVTDDVLVTEVHELAEFANLGMVIHSLRAAQFRVQRKSGAGLNACSKFLILQLHTPNTGTSGTTVLLEHALTVRQ